MQPSLSADVMPPIPLSAYNPFYGIRHVVVSTPRGRPFTGSSGAPHHSLLDHHHALLRAVRLVVAAHDPIERRRVGPDVLHRLDDLGRELDLVRDESPRRAARAPARRLQKNGSIAGRTRQARSVVPSDPWRRHAGASMLPRAYTSSSGWVSVTWATAPKCFWHRTTSFVRLCEVSIHISSKRQRGTNPDDVVELGVLGAQVDGDVAALPAEGQHVRRRRVLVVEVDAREPVAQRRG